MESLEAKLARLDERIEHVLIRIDRLVTKDEFTPVNAKLNELVTQAEFRPVRLVVYGLVGVILMAVVGGLVSAVVQ